MLACFKAVDVFPVSHHTVNATGSSYQWFPSVTKSLVREFKFFPFFFLQKREKEIGRWVKKRWQGEREGSGHTQEQRETEREKEREREREWMTVSEKVLQLPKSHSLYTAKENQYIHMISKDRLILNRFDNECEFNNTIPEPKWHQGLVTDRNYIGVQHIGKRAGKASH